MQIVKVMGGLGNQMFAYAFALALRRLGREVFLDTSWHDRYRAHNGWELGRVFNLGISECDAASLRRLADLSSDLVSRVRRKMFGPRAGHYVEKGFSFDGRYLEITGDAYFEGFWQSPRYHEGIETEIEKEFSFPGELETEGVKLLELGKSLIGVHVRRGDYLESDALGGVCGESYYRRAIAELTAAVKEPLVVFFSDDLDWCRDRLSGSFDAIFVDWNRGTDSWKDLRLMTLCGSLAISNSSFGWWGARLGTKPGRRVVVPDRWYGGRHPDNTDIVPRGWIRISTGGAV